MPTNLLGVWTEQKVEDWGIHVFLLPASLLELWGISFLSPWVGIYTVSCSGSQALRLRLSHTTDLCFWFADSWLGLHSLHNWMNQLLIIKLRVLCNSLSICLSWSLPHCFWFCFSGKPWYSFLTCTVSSPYKAFRKYIFNIEYHNRSQGILR